MKDRTRIFDVFIAGFCLLAMLPLFILVALLVRLSSKGPILFRQVRVGMYNRDFVIYKFRTMYTDTHHKSALTVGDNDPRITVIGFFLRKYKLDEMPQLLNVLKGDMSMVGPRPELRKFVNMYSEEQKKVLLVRPGITDYASVEYKNENELLASVNNPENYYVHYIMPKKIDLNNKYLQDKSLSNYFRIILHTVFHSA